MRILLNHFGWDKEKLLEAYYDGDPSKLFKAARVIDPRIPRPQITNPASGAEDCHICYLQKPSSVSDCVLHHHVFILKNSIEL